MKNVLFVLLFACVSLIWCSSAVFLTETQAQDKPKSLDLKVPQGRGVNCIKVEMGFACAEVPLDNDNHLRASFSDSGIVIYRDSYSIFEAVITITTFTTHGNGGDLDFQFQNKDLKGTAHFKLYTYRTAVRSGPSSNGVMLTSGEIHIVSKE